MTSPTPDFGADPATFFVPGRDPGLWLAGPAQSLWTAVPAGRFRGAQMSEVKRINALWRAEQEVVTNERCFPQTVEFSADLAVVEDITIARDCMAIGGKWALSGPVGERLLARNSKLWAKKTSRQDWEDRFTQHIAKAQESYAAPPRWTADTRDLPFVIEASNLANYYHFTKELMSSLSLLDALPDWRGRVQIVSERPEPSGFATRWLETLFPELRDRIDYLPSPQHFDRALTVWHGDISYLQAGAAEIAQFSGPEHPLANGVYTTSLAKQLRFGGYSQALRYLRDRGLAAIAGQDFSHLPRRFWVGRKPGEAHDRRLKNEDEIIARLARRGFEPVFFEDLSPLEQIAIMARAEVMVSYHGAGFANMLYAAPTTHVVELGTLQTGRIRLGDFIGFAHVSGADYVVGVADFDHDGPEVIPPMRGHGIYPVRLSDRGLRRLLALVDEVVDGCGTASDQMSL